jgi:hypothetical protein
MNENRMRAKRALAALRAADQNGMGRVAGGMGAEATDRLADLDASTAGYRAWSPALIPGLLQTGSYTAGAIKSRTPSLGAAEVGRRVTHRRVRCESFLARRTALDNQARAWFLIGEQAVARPLMNDFAHAEQLRRILALERDYPNIVVQVLSDDSPMPGTIEPFELFYLDPGPPVGHLETMVGGFYTIASEDIARLHGAFSEMTGFAMTPADSREYISEVLHTCWEHTAEPSSSSLLTPTLPTASTSPVPPPAPSE